MGTTFNFSNVTADSCYKFSLCELDNEKQWSTKERPPPKITASMNLIML